MARKHFVALLGALIAVALGVAGPASAGIADEITPLHATATVIAATHNADAPLAAISSSDQSTLTSFAQFERPATTRIGIAAPLGVNPPHTSRVAAAQALRDDVARALHARTLLAGPISGRAPPAVLN